MPVVVVEIEVSPGSGEFVVDERLRADDVSLGSDAAIASAVISVRLDDDLDAAAARDRYFPDCRLVVRTDHPDPLQRTMLFDGYPLLQEAQWSRDRDSYRFVASGVYSVLSRDRRAWVHGRRMRNGCIEDGLMANPDVWKSRSVLVEALPCVFNTSGKGNCSPDPLEVVAPDGSARYIHVFTWDDDPDAIPWTYRNALRYLAWFHLLPEGPVAEGNVFSATDGVAEGPLPAAPDGLDCQAVSLVEALARLARECGVHVTPTTVNDAGRARTELRIWSAVDAAEETLALARGGRHADGTPRYDSRSARASEVLAANEIHEAMIRWDSRRIVNAPVVIGDVRRYEMTVPLVPGWLPETDLDNVAPEDRAAAKSLALTPDQVSWLEDPETSAWYRRYHAAGSEFDAYRDVARQWVLNEDGRYGAAYNRNAPFDDYRPFDFSAVADGSVTLPGVWTRRCRPFRPTITPASDGRRFGVHVEVSFDGGTTWSRPQGPVRIPSDATGVYLAVTNPTSIRPPGVAPEEQNLWYAIIDQTFRVRVTAVFDADERLVVRRCPDDGHTPTLRTTSRLVYRPGWYGFQSREGTTNALVAVNPDAGVERDDTEAAARLADAIARQEEDERVFVTPAIPWLDTRFAIGARIGGIPGRRIATGGTVVIGKRYRFAGGRYETRLVLGK